MQQACFEDGSRFSGIKIHGNRLSRRCIPALLYKSCLQAEPAEIQTAGDAFHALVHGVVGLTQRLVDGGDHQILKHFHIFGVHGLRLDGHGEDFLRAVDLGFHNTAAYAGGELLCLTAS